MRIVCPLHGEFKQLAKNHEHLKQGCKKCALEYTASINRITNEKFLQEVNFIFKEFGYTYLNEYKGIDALLKINCPIHGNFEVSAHDHKNRKIGCLACSKEKRNGWSLQEWLACAKASKNFDSYKVYIVKCFNENEEFIKIGKTFLNIKNRFPSKYSLPYDYEVIKKITFTEGELAFDKEIEMHRHLKEFKYKPLKDFGGKTECFSLECLSSLEAYLKL